MIKALRFFNYKALRDATLPLGRFTLILGPNGSGKTTALEAIRFLYAGGNPTKQELISASQREMGDQAVGFNVQFGPPYDGLAYEFRFNERGNFTKEFKHLQELSSANTKEKLDNEIQRMRIYSLDYRQIHAPVHLTPKIDLGAEGGSLAAVLDQLRDNDHERLQSLNQQLRRLLPEFDSISFETPSAGHRSLLLSTREGKYKIKAKDLSQGTLFVLTILALAFLPDPPPLVGIEEPEHGIHPRLLKELREVLYRLSYPEIFQDNRRPVQVIATTHSPYLLDLFKDHPEEIVISQKKGLDASFQRLVDLPNIKEILKDAPFLGQVWFTGILGGVPSEQ
jgi:predicted ATPase